MRISDWSSDVCSSDLVFFDSEHFFDGYKANPEYALRVLEAAATNGADCLVMCDTNGGSLPHQVQRIAGEVHAYFGADQQLGIHTQNDSGCAVANSVAAVLGGATQLQGTVNGYGERTGNANLMTCIPNLELKLGVRCLPEGRIARLTAVSRHVRSAERRVGTECVRTCRYRWS